MHDVSLVAGVSSFLWAGCVETGLTPKQVGPSALDSGTPDSADPHSGGPDDSGGPAPCAVSPAPAGRTTQARTCSALGEVRFELALELDHQNIVDAGNWAYIGAPVVSPTEGAAPPEVLFQSWVHDYDDGSVVAVDPALGVVVWQIDDVGYDADQLAVARDAMADGLGMMRLAVPGATRRVVCAAGDGTIEEHPFNLDSAPSMVDFDHDGVTEIIEEHLVLDSACAVLFEAPERYGNGVDRA